MTVLYHPAGRAPRGDSAAAACRAGRVRNNDGVPILDETRRIEFLEAAAAVIADRGYGNTRLADVARHLGVSAPLIVHYFGTRDHLLTEALRYTEDRFYELVAERLAPISSPTAQLAELINVCCSPEPAAGLPQGWALWFEIWVRAAHDPEASRDRAELDARWTATVVEIIRRGQLVGEFAKDVEPERAAHILTALLDGLSVQIQLKDETITVPYAIDLATEVARRHLAPTS